MGILSYNHLKIVFDAGKLFKFSSVKTEEKNSFNMSHITDLSLAILPIVLLKVNQLHI